MPSTFRIPKADHHRRSTARCSPATRGGPTARSPTAPSSTGTTARCSRRCSGFEQKVAKWRPLDPHLKSYAQIASAGVIGCCWCLDFGYFLAHDDGLDLAKVREVPRWRESDVFDDTERAVIEYAEAMSTTPLGVTDEMVAGLIERLGVEAVVELTRCRAGERCARGSTARPGWRARATPTSASFRSPVPP